jgi:hypothetical protein
MVIRVVLWAALGYVVGFVLMAAYEIGFTQVGLATTFTSALAHFSGLIGAALGAAYGFFHRI